MEWRTAERRGRRRASRAKSLRQRCRLRWPPQLPRWAKMRRRCLRLSAMMPSLAAWERRGEKLDPTGARETHHLNAARSRSHAKGRAQADGEGGMAERLLRNVAGAGGGRFRNRCDESCPGRMRGARAQRLDICGARGRQHRRRSLCLDTRGVVLAFGSDSRRRMRSYRRDVRRTRPRHAPRGVPCGCLGVSIACRPASAMRFIRKAIPARCCSSRPR